LIFAICNVTQPLIKLLTNPVLQNFICENEHVDEHALLLKQKTIFEVPISVVADQIVGRRKAKTKIPEFYLTKGIIYPPGINLEQCSSEATAIFKSNLLNGKTCADLTGGFGVDSFFLSKKFENFHYIEPDNKLYEIVKHNHNTLGALNIQHHLKSAEEFLAETNLHFDCIYIDPSRRAEGNKKVFKLSECEPNIIALQKTIFEKSDQLLIKVSPLLDLQQALKELQFVKKVFVVSVDNECKEVLFLCTKIYEQDPPIETINITHKGNQIFGFKFSEEQKIEIEFSNPMRFLYEPNASILKAGGFKLIALKFNLKKIHPSTHFYTTDNLKDGFPGRVFEIKGEVKPDKKSWNIFFSNGKANITTRNYPLSPEELKKKTGLKDGGEKYLIGFSGIDRKYLVVADRVR
jgi:16S rRNA G966 N2-methylase RsmD